MRRTCFLAALALVAVTFSAAQQSAPASARGYTLTVIIEGINQKDGHIGMLVFNSPKGWAEDRTAALRDIYVPAQPGTMTIKVPNLAAGEYAVAVLHDVNNNHKLDRNWLNKPTEQWGLSNNPHAVIKTPAYSKCTFQLKGDMEIHIQMQM
ncbi:MAG TPA: DUF2141 domain-containing protein [Terriglobales bacterium]|nr:DUF2141 domain-containing protein [Terriglobales bacterium]